MKRTDAFEILAAVVRLRAEADDERRGFLLL